MNGTIDSDGRALVKVSVRPSSQTPWTLIEAWIDTAFLGTLMLPEVAASALGLTFAGLAEVELADGSKAMLSAYHSHIDWFGQARRIEAIASDSLLTLLGVRLLKNRDVQLSYRGGTVTIA